MSEGHLIQSRMRMDEVEEKDKHGNEIIGMLIKEKNFIWSYTMP